MQQTCTNCSAAFEITDGDLEFYDAISPTFAEKKYPLPPPEMCPACRYQQRLTWRNERSLHRQICDATGESIVSIFSPDKEWPPVYKQSYWWSDKWDPTSYGRDIDFNRPFFEQWAELFRDVPQIAMNNQQSENCEYTNQSQRNKDCYMVFCSDYSRDCMYGMWLQHCENCVDNQCLEKSELCYEIANSMNCYRCTSSQNIENCSSVHFSKNCIGCRNCFGCINLRNKEYMFLNEQCSKEEYRKKLEALRLDTYSGREKASELTAPHLKQIVHKYYVGSNTEEFSGDYVVRVKNAMNCFNCRDAENLKHSQDAWHLHNCQDMTEVVENDYCYFVEGTGTSSHSLFCKKACDLSNSIYCSHCHFSKNLFGCIGMKHAQYCILNKQYTEEEYEELAGKILEHMQSTGEWGQHFPPEYSPFGYNETVAQEYFPLEKDAVVAKRWKWRDAEDEVPDVEKVIPADTLPDAIGDVPDDILDWAIACPVTGRPFRIIKQELKFYRTMGLPIPRLHPDERHWRRMALRNPRKLWSRECGKCSKAIQTTYAPGRPEKVYCEECYLQEVN